MGQALQPGGADLAAGGGQSGTVALFRAIWRQRNCYWTALQLTISFYMLMKLRIDAPHSGGGHSTESAEIASHGEGGIVSDYQIIPSHACARA